MYQFDVYSIGIFGGGTTVGALQSSLDHLLNWCRDEEEEASAISGLHDLRHNGILSFDYTYGGNRTWYEFSVK